MKNYVKVFIVLCLSFFIGCGAIAFGGNKVEDDSIAIGKFGVFTGFASTDFDTYLLAEDGEYYLAKSDYNMIRMTSGYVGGEVVYTISKGRGSTYSALVFNLRMDSRGSSGIDDIYEFSDGHGSVLYLRCYSFGKKYRLKYFSKGMSAIHEVRVSY